MTRMPVPPFSYADAVQKVRMAEDAWNTRDPERVALAYTSDTKWRNRSEFLNGRDEVRRFLIRKWSVEKSYRLIKEIWAHGDDRIAVRFCYEYNDDTGQWFRAHGNDNWEFDAEGYMSARHASINDVAIAEPKGSFIGHKVHGLWNMTGCPIWACDRHAFGRIIATRRCCCSCLRSANLEVLAFRVANRLARVLFQEPTPAPVALQPISSLLHQTCCLFKVPNGERLTMTMQQRKNCETPFI